MHLFLDIFVWVVVIGSVITLAGFLLEFVDRWHKVCDAVGLNRNTPRTQVLAEVARTHDRADWCGRCGGLVDVKYKGNQVRCIRCGSYIRRAEAK